MISNKSLSENDTAICRGSTGATIEEEDITDGDKTLGSGGNNGGSGGGDLEGWS